MSEQKTKKKTSSKSSPGAHTRWKSSGQWFGPLPGCRTTGLPKQLLSSRLCNCPQPGNCHWLVLWQSYFWLVFVRIVTKMLITSLLPYIFVKYSVQVLGKRAERRHDDGDGKNKNQGWKVIEGLMVMTIEKIKFDYLSEARLRTVSVKSWESRRRGDWEPWVASSNLDESLFIVL